MKEKALKYRNLIDILIIILVACFLGIPLFNSSLNVYLDDGIQHIARAYGTSISLKENFLFPNIISSFTNGFGYSWNLFYGPISSYCIIILNIIFSNFIIAYKALLLLSIMLSGYFMYKFVTCFSGDNNAGNLAGILYMSFPYHLTDIYTRNALGECLSFVFIPLVFLGLYNLLYTSSNNYHLAIGGIGLILTHNLSTLIVLFFSCLYLAINIEKLKNSNIKKYLIINILFILLVTSFFWLPLLETKFTTNYQVYEEGMMATKESTASRGLRLTQLFVSRNDGSFVFELGPHIIIMMCFSVMAIRLMREELKETYVFCLLSGILTLWMSTKYFPWKFLPNEISIIQFPWRMLMMSSFFLSVVCSLNVYILIKNFNLRDVIIISCIAVFYTFAFVRLLTI